MKAALLAGLMTIAFAGLAQAEGVTPASSSTAPAAHEAGQPVSQPATSAAENHAKHVIKKRVAMNKKAMKDKKADASKSKDEKAATPETH